MNKKKLFLMGFLLMALPLLFQLWEGIRQKNIVSTYWSEMDKFESAELETDMENARQYNEKIYQSSNLLNVDKDREFEKEYETQLSLSVDGIMGTLEIPRISLRLPIYHGTSERVLSKGIGHLKGSSLPVGGINAHAVLTGHRGVPNAQLFTRLDEVEKEDVFFIRVCDEVLAYRVQTIQIVEPEEVEVIKIQPGVDRVSLITCTPYGLNTHRLVVTGERTDEVETIEANETKAEINLISKRDVLLIAILIIFLIIAWNRWFSQKKRKQMKKGVLAAAAICFLCFPIDTLAAEGTVQFVLPDDEQERIYYSKVADMEGDTLKIREEYKECGLDMNTLKTAKDLEKAAEELDGMLNNPTVLSVKGKTQIEIGGLEEGVYLFRIKGDKKWNPILLSVPTWIEADDEMTYQVTVIPKHAENPKTGWEDGIICYYVLLMASLLVVKKIMAHKN